VADHDPRSSPTGLEALLAGLGELAPLFGAAGRAVIPALQARLSEAMAARDRGDPVEVMQAIGAAMEQLAGLADRLDPQDAMLMRAVAERFRAALVSGDLSEAKRDLATMFERSGARYRKPQG
jgi:hypothetical protein